MTDWAAKTWRLLIGGEWVDGAGGTYEVINPATEGVVGRAPEASVDQTAPNSEPRPGAAIRASPARCRPSAAPTSG